MKIDEVRAALTGAADRLRRSPRVPATDGPELSPYVKSLSVLGQSVRVQRRVNIALLVGLGAIVAWQQVRIHGLVNEVRGQDYLVVPGAADFVRVRPNLVPDTAVIEFATYFADRLTNVTHRDIEDRYASMSRYMAPPLWTRLQRDLEHDVPVLKSIQGAEVMSWRRPAEIDRQTWRGQPVFVAELHGRIERFASDERLAAEDEVVVVVFRTTPLSADTPWMFEVVEFQRRTTAEHGALGQALAEETP